jgi:Ricin-type beta-trefoil lectin domain-like
MSYYSIKSKLNGNVIDILGAATAAGTPLDSFTQNAPVSDNQLWEFVADPQGSGYYFIKSKLKGLVIDIQNGDSTAGLKDATPLEVNPQKAGGTSGQTDSQLWQFVKDPSGSGYFFIMSKLNGNVIDILGASSALATPLDSYPLKPSATDNQLWQVVGGSFPATVSMVADSGLGSNSNYVLSSDCDPIYNAFVVVEVTQDIVCKSVAPPKPKLCKPVGAENVVGFSFQMNCYSSPKETCAYQQYVMAFFQNSSGGFNVINGIDNWPVKGPNLFNNNSPTFYTLPSAVLPTGYQAMFGWSNNAATTGMTPNVTGAFWELWDNNGNLIGRASQNLFSLPSGDLAPITAFELNIVGPINGESAVLSSGAGFISYIALKPPLSASASRPTKCTETGSITCETANTFYGPLPSNSNTYFKQSFLVSSDKAMLHKEGTPRPSTRYSTEQLQKILSSKKS